MSDPQVDEIVLRFQNLRSKTSRRAVYLALLEELRNDEMREVKARVDQEDFHKDILGALPLEVAAQVASHLEVTEVVYLQVVCRRWRYLLNSSLVRDSVMQARYGQLVQRESRGREPKDQDQDRQDEFMRFAKQRSLLERGKPVAQGHFSWQLPLEDIGLNAMDYYNGKYAWVEMNTFVCVRRLSTGQLQRFCTENRDTFDLIRVTDEIVAAYSPRGVCHVWSLEGEHYGAFHLPSACFEKFVANGTKIAFNYRESLYHWDLRSQVTHTVTIPLGLHLLVLHPTEDRIATVHIALQGSNRYIGSIPTDRAQFTLYKFVRGYDCPDDEHEQYEQHRQHERQLSHNLHGHHQQQGQQDQQSLPAFVDFHQVSAEVLPLPHSIGPGGAFYQDLTDRKNRCNHRLGSVHISWHNNRDLTEALILTANPLTGAVVMHRTWPGSIHNVGLSMAAVAPDILYYVRKVEGSPTLWISNPGNARGEHRSSTVISRDLVYRDLKWAEFDRKCLILGDASNLLVVDPAGLRVWCFDERQQAFGAVPISY